MNNYRFNSLVSNSEQEALKEMIFKRARERAQAITNEIQSDYTTSVQNDVMDLARESFNVTKNPFAQTTKSETKPTDEKNDEIGFAKRQVKEIKFQITSNNKNINYDITSRELEATMNQAREDFSKKPSFMGALNFLNSQASIALVKNKGKNFEALA